MEQQLHKNISDIWQDQYVVPLYQRNFAWTEEQINQLIQDIYDHHLDTGNYYLGSLVVLQRNDGSFEVIDGQQRLTALQILCKELGLLSTPRLRYDSRPEVEEFFGQLFNSNSCSDCYENLKGKNSQKIYRLKDALKIVSDTKIRTKENAECCFKDLRADVRYRIGEYLREKVILIRIPLPLDTDVAAYFEIMNNRGEQLKPHEVIKALVLGNPTLTPQQREIISTVWNACSEMDRPIQSSLSNYRRNREIGMLFGEDFDTLNLEYLSGYNSDAEFVKPRGLDEIIDGKLDGNANSGGGDKEDKYKSIVDFSNFLTHVFKMYDETVELNGDNLRNGFDKIAQCITDPMEFIKHLLKIRVLFDRYVVKLQAEDEEDENLNWILHRPYSSRNSQGNDSLRYKNTFSKPTGEADDKDETDDQKRVVKQLSMLQVTFRNQKYKNWLFDYLKWLNKNYGERVESVSASEVVHFLDDWIENYFSSNIENAFIDENGNQLLRQGVKTPHFLFNFIDYLYWLNRQKDHTDIRHISFVQDFKFKYYNSVEHHRPQSYSREDVDLDCIGNLCLISRRSNSSLNDKDAREKANVDKRNLQPKRKIMYEITSSDDWGKKQIEEHQKDIDQLLASRHDVLNIERPDPEAIIPAI